MCPPWTSSPSLNLLQNQTRYYSRKSWLETLVISPRGGRGGGVCKNRSKDFSKRNIGKRNVKRNIGVGELYFLTVRTCYCLRRFFIRQEIIYNFQLARALQVWTCNTSFATWIFFNLQLKWVPRVPRAPDRISLKASTIFVNSGMFQDVVTRRYLLLVTGKATLITEKKCRGRLSTTVRTIHPLNLERISQNEICNFCKSKIECVINSKPKWSLLSLTK